MSLRIIPPFGSIVSHTFRCKTLADVAKEIEAFPPNYKAAWNKPKWEHSFDPNTMEQNLTLKLILAMPVWKNSNRPQKERDEWLRVYKVLYIHEKGHLKIYTDEAKHMYSKLVTGKTQKEITSIYNSELKRIYNKQKQYDITTDHGRKQECEYGNTTINY